VIYSGNLQPQERGRGARGDGVVFAARASETVVAEVGTHPSFAPASVAEAVLPIGKARNPCCVAGGVS
jgi:hypothetical protein